MEEKGHIKVQRVGKGTAAAAAAAAAAAKEADTQRQVHTANVRPAAGLGCGTRRTISKTTAMAKTKAQNIKRRAIAIATPHHTTQPTNQPVNQ